MSLALIISLALHRGQIHIRPQTSWSWLCQGANPQHTGATLTPSQSMANIHWSTKIDLNPTYSGSDLLTHYGSPMVTYANHVVVPVKQGTNAGFSMRVFDPATGQVLFGAKSDYILPPHDWIPMCGPCLSIGTIQNVGQLVYYPAAGGIITARSADYARSKTLYAYPMGRANFLADPSAYTSTVFVDTPLTPGPDGSVYYGITVSGSNPAGLKSGFVRVKGQQVTYVAVADIVGDSDITDVKQNCAPAVSNDGSSIYVVVNGGNFSKGYLMRLDAQTLQPLSKVLLKDPNNGNNADVDDDGTAAPMVGPDNDVYFGVLENPFGSNHVRGWMLHFNSDLSQEKTPGAFGWDDTASVVPASMVPSYAGSSTYLLATKYNNYVEGGGDGANKIAVLDPNDVQTDPVTGISTMKEILTLVGPKHDPRFDPNQYPNAVYEWCVDTIAVDPASDSIIVNSEDGNMYRWNLASNTITQSVMLTSGIGEAYTPTIVGVDGTIYGMSNATLFAIGN